jgi:hypothetical protein
MNTKKSIIFLISLLVIISLILTTLPACGGKEEKTSEVRGFATLDKPLSGATITIKNINGKQIFKEQQATSEFGAFNLNIRSLPDSFTIVATGGNLGQVPFSGTLSCDVAGFNNTDIIFYQLNPVSTLVSRYRANHAGLSLDQADIKVKQFLAIPEDLEMTGYLGWPQTAFDPVVYTAQTMEAGSFDRFTNQLVAEIDSGTSHEFRTPESNFVLTEAITALVTWGFKTLASGAVSAIGGKAMNTVFTMIFGSKEATAEQVEEIKAQLVQVEADLVKIQSTVNDIKATVDSMNQRLQVMQWDQAIAPVISPINKINETFDKVKNLATAAKTNPALYQNDVVTLSQESGEILSSTSGVYGAIGELDMNIQGIMGKTSLLKLQADKVLLKLTYANRQDVYDYMESFFSGLLGIEVKGLYLIAEAYAQQGKYEMLEAYLASFYQNKLAPQAELFLKCVEDVVMANYEVRSGELLPRETAIMLPQADWFYDTVLNSYNVSVSTGKLDVSKESRVLTVRVQSTNGISSQNAVLLSDRYSTNQINLPNVRNQAYTYDGLSFNLGRFVFKETPETTISDGFYRVVNDSQGTVPEVVANLYNEKQLTINDSNKYGTWGVCNTVFAPARYYQIANKNSGKTLEFDGPSTSVNAHIQQWDWWGSTNQLWNWPGEWTGMTVGYGPVKNNYSGMTMDVQGNGTANGTRVVQNTFNNTDNQLWLSQAGNAFGTYYLLKAKSTGKFADIDGKTSADGANLVQWDQVSGAGSQQWYLENVNGLLKITNVLSGKVLEVAGPSKEDSAHLQQYAWANGDSQKWRFEYVGQGYYRIVNLYSQKVMDVFAFNKNDGAEIRQWTSNGAQNQLWKIEATGDGSYRITNKYTGKVVDTEGQSKGDGARVYQWTWDGRNSQRWQLSMQ